jgi:23S rRNA (cytidine1920-2'-O)/16S rRNA (cytidine1409-2'-O)-methyltransferase
VAESREQAQRLIMAGEVTVDGQRAGQAGPPRAHARCDPAVKRRCPMSAAAGEAGRGAERLCLDVAGLVAVDVGASTGGFTDCLLQRGAARVYAIDVGYGQLAWKLQSDPRVVVLDRTNVRHLPQLPGAAPWPTWP